MQRKLKLALQLLRGGRDPFLVLTYLELHSALQGCRSVLDVGCGPASPLRLYGFERLVGIEGFAPSVETARKNATHHEVVLGDARELDRIFKPGQFDACIAIDVIEHLTPAEGRKLAADMDRIAARAVVLFTPNGFLPQSHSEAEDLQEHHSGWTAEEMRQLGFEVHGALGPKGLRGSYHVLRHRPRIFWGVISLLGHLLWTRRHPARASALLCVKRKG